MFNLLFLKCGISFKLVSQCNPLHFSLGSFQVWVRWQYILVQMYTGVVGDLYIHSELRIQVTQTVKYIGMEKGKGSMFVRQSLHITTCIWPLHHIECCFNTTSVVLKHMSDAEDNADDESCMPQHARQLRGKVRGHRKHRVKERSSRKLKLLLRVVGPHQERVFID